MGLLTCAPGSLQLILIILSVHCTLMEAQLNLFYLLLVATFLPAIMDLSQGRVITGREVITNSNSERGYRDVILVFGTLTSSTEGSRPSYSVRLIYDPFGLNKMKQFCFSSNLSQLSIGGRQGSNACTIIASLVGYQFVKLRMPKLTLSALPSQLFDVIVDSMLEGNALHDLLFYGGLKP